jgi:hypothetical protein
MAAEIAKAFPRRPPGVIYAWGDTIYNPGGHLLHPPILAHEAEHGRRQQMRCTPETWWRRYIEDQEFRYFEELFAHAVELKAQMTGDRNRNACLRTSTAARLLAPFYEYDSSVDMQTAMRDLRREVARL